MKTTYKLLFSLALTFASVIAPSLEGRAGGGSALAQSVGEAFYIYRNDGGFNAFFREEIDSIAYSCYDADSTLYDDAVMQVVYTKDSIYQIPLAAIDSVSFVQPETVVNKEVFPLTAAHDPYLSQADTLHFTMSLSTPDDMRPRVGNIVVSTSDCTVFPYGILATVDYVNRTLDGYVYTCSKAYVEDIFDQIVVYEKGSATSDNEVKPLEGAPRRVTINSSLRNLQWNRTIEGGGTTTTLNVGERATASITICKTLTTPFYAQIALQNNFTSSIDFKAVSEASISIQKQIGQTFTAGRIPIPYTMNLLWLEPKISLYGYFEEKGKVELNYAGHFNRSDRLSFTYTRGNWTFDHNPEMDAGNDVARLSMEGSAEVGLIPQIDISLNGQQAGFGMKVKAGLKEYINFVFDATRLSGGGFYDAMRDSYCRTTIPWSVQVYANANIFARYDSNQSGSGPATLSHTFRPKSEPQLGEDRYILPLFSEPRWQSDGSTSGTLSTTVSRRLLLPVSVGMKVTDEKGKTIDEKMSSNTTTQFSGQTSSFSVSGLKGNTEYTARPTLSIMGYQMDATPTAKFKTEADLCPDSNHPHMIDLGIGTLWACCNVGASAPEQYGNYYAWGETSPKSVYNWETYQYGYYNYDGDYSHLVNIGSDISGTSYDAARANWGAPWRMPTSAECQALLLNCSSEWTTLNGVYGRKFTGSNGGSIFLPAAGHRGSGELGDAGDWGFYWSSTLHESNPIIPYFFYFYSYSGGTYWGDWRYRTTGHSVRPVR